MKTTPSKIYEILYEHYGTSNWWPMDLNYHRRNNTDPRAEIIIGAILTQNTSWSNVEKALENLKNRNMLDLAKIFNADITLIRKLIKPSGFFNQKSKRLKEISVYIFNKYKNDLDEFFSKELNEIRNELLSINGIGPETADTILLYAGNLPIFVVDNYTKRLCQRLPLDVSIKYRDIQCYFQKELKKTFETEKLTQIYNEIHALIVNLAKDYCKKKPICKNCPLKRFCNFFEHNKYVSQ